VLITTYQEITNARNNSFNFSFIMLKFLTFAILLASSPAFGLLETLFDVENNCYSGCHSNYAINLAHFDSCKKGCNYKLHNENCAEQCKTFSIDEQIQASCLVGCSMISERKVDVERPRSIILIRLRQRPMLELPSFNRIFNNDPVQMFNDMIKQLKEDTNEMQQSNELKTIIHLTKNIPVLKLSNEERKDNNIESENNRLQQLITDIRTEWNDLIRKQPKIPIWILFGILLSSSIILWYMIVSLCRHKPTHRNVSIRAQDLIFNDTYEKEKIQPDDQHYESLPIKVKLSNI